MKKFLSLIIVGIIVLSASACGSVTRRFNPDKTQIQVVVFNGGAGMDWINEVSEEFNQKNDKYEIVLYPKKVNAGSIISDIQMGNEKRDIFFTSEIGFQSGIRKGYFEDLSDVLDMRIEGETKTIGQKMKNYDNWVNMASKDGQGCYILPYLDAYMGLVYDHSLFVNNGWLNFADSNDIDALNNQGITFTTDKNKLKFVSSTGSTNYQEGDYILKAGKDGKFGTYDDGQPQTVSEFDNMIELICDGNRNAKSFIYSGEYDNYLNYIIYAFAAQYIGAEQFNNFAKYDSDGEPVEMYDGSQEVININNAYKQFNAKCFYESFSITDKYFNDTTRVDNQSFDILSFSHTDAQNEYILGYKKSTGYPAMLVEGTWWENEARSLFNSISVQDPDYGFGKRNYRFMLLPNLEGQNGALGNGKGSVFSASDTGGIVVRKQGEDETEKLSKIKEFLTMTMSDSCLRNFTKTTGITRPFEYSLSESELQEMTPFARNAYEIYNDTENISILRLDVTRYAQPILYTSKINNISFIPMSRDKREAEVNYIRILRDASVNDIMNNMYYGETEWTSFVNDAKSAGFYLD